MKHVSHRRWLALILSLAVTLGCMPVALAAAGTTDQYALTGSGSRLGIAYDGYPGELIRLNQRDFREFYSEKRDGSLHYVTFTDSSSYSSSVGSFYANYGDRDEARISRASLTRFDFYDSSTDDGDYPLNSLAFEVSNSAEEQDVTLDFTAYGSDGDCDGTLTIQILDDETDDGTISYTVRAGGDVSLRSADFQDYFSERSRSDTLRYVVFQSSSSLRGAQGSFWYDYGGSGALRLDTDRLTSHRFYASSGTYGDYPISDISYAAARSVYETITLPFTAYGQNERYGGTLRIEVSGSSSASSGSSTSNREIVYEAAPGSSVSFRRSDFNAVYRETRSGSPRYVVFTAGSLSGGVLSVGTRDFTRSNLGSYRFYYNASSEGDYALDDLVFEADREFSGEIKLTARIYGEDGSATASVILRPAGNAEANSGGRDMGTVSTVRYSVRTGGAVVFLADDFRKAAESKLPGTLDYVTFSSGDLLSSSVGALYADYRSAGEKAFTRETLAGVRFYAGAPASGGYALSGLAFAAPDYAAARTVTLSCTLYDDRNNTASGTVEIRLDKPADTENNGAGSGVSNTGNGGGGAPISPADTAQADIRYIVSNQSPIQLNAGDFNRFFQRYFPSGALSGVWFQGVPASGQLWYNYYETTQYGSAHRLTLTAENIASQEFRFQSAALTQYSLSELTYIPAAGVNACVRIPFTAVGTAEGQSVRGTVLISATHSAVADVYGVSAKGATVNFPVSAVTAAVKAATGVEPAGIRLLRLSEASVGTVRQGDGSPAAAGQAFSLSGDAAFPGTAAGLRFVPDPGYTGSVEIPYEAADSSGAAFAAGNFCVGIVNQVKRFSDVSSSSWCFKYVTELADAGIVGGYEDGTFQPDAPVTYGAALKLVMLAAGYPEQIPTDPVNVFGGYLDKAREEGIVVGTAVNLSALISRVQVARMAAAAMKLDLTGLPSVRPFTDTADLSVQALNGAGIINGYFADGVSTFRPDGTLTRGQLAAIVWRMRSAQ